MKKALIFANISRRLAALVLALAMLAGFSAAESITAIPQIDNSTARIPITDAIYTYFAEQGAEGPSPMCSKTHGAWLNLADGTADIIFLVAPTVSEMEYLDECGVDVEMKIFGFDGLVFMGNATNPVENITSAEIRAIYRGEKKNWVGIGDYRVWGEIVPYIRNSESGSQRLFENLVWTGYEMPDFRYMGFEEGEVQGLTPVKMEEIDDMSDITYSVMKNRFSIGYNIMSYVENVFFSDEVEQPKVITTGSVNLRSWAGLDEEIIAAVPAGTELKYLFSTEFDERDVAWYEVEYEGMNVWVSSRYSRLEIDNSALKLFNVDGYAPTTENFANGNYPFVTTSYVVIRADEAEDSPARQLFDWIGSEDSRAIIEANSTLSVAFSDSVVIHAGAGDPARSEVINIINALPERTLDRSELRAFNEKELTYIWQGVYAHAGLAFSREIYSSYFDVMEWYLPEYESYGEAGGNMSNILRENLKTLAAYLADLRRATAAAAPRVFAWNEEDECMSGSDVLVMQEALFALGYLSEENCTGNYDENSMEAVAAFQKDCGAEETGIFDAFTRMMLL